MRAILLATAMAFSSLAEKPAPVTEPPKIIERSDPQYTEAARKARVEGSVHLAGVIGVDGRVGDIQIVEPLGYGLGDKAVECVRKWRFKPAMRDGVPVPVKANLQVRFHLPSP
jgi:TonB family protein